MENSVEVPQKNLDPSYDQLSHYPKNMKITYPVFIAALLTRDKT